MSKKIFVTGGCGFIGANLAKQLLAQGHEVTIYDNLSRGFLDYVREFDTRVIQGDIRDLGSLRAAMRGAEAVIHLAAYGSVVESITDPDTNFEINVRGTFNVLRACADNGVGKMLFASTGGALIGNAPPPVSEGSLPKPISPYGSSKLCGEAYCNSFAHSYGIETVALRFANVYGPLSAHKLGAVTVFIKNILKGAPITIYGDGSASRDFLHVSDICNGICKALHASLPPATVLHLASGAETTVRQLAEIIINAAGSTSHPIVHLPARRGEVSKNFARYDLAKELIGYEPQIPLTEGMRATYQWYASLSEEALKIKASDS